MFGGTGGAFSFGTPQQQPQQQQPQQQGAGLFGGGASTFGGTSTAFGAPATPAFGQQAQPQQTTAFGGFGQQAQTGAFGQPATSAPAFGQSTPASGGLFGATAQAAAPSTGFTFGGGGTSTAFGATPASGATTGGLFGAAKPATTTFGGFGAQQTPAAGGGLFGGGAATTGFGQPAIQPGQGTAAPPYVATSVLEPPKEEGKPTPTNQTPHVYHSINAMPAYQGYSFEELRAQDYQANRKTPTAATPTAGGFGSTFGGATSTPAFGQAAPTTSLFGGGATSSTFGQPAAAAPTPFGQPAAKPSIFGGGGTFGQTQSTPSLFGGATSTAPATGGLFGQTSSTPAFGQAQQTTTPAFGGFGAATAAKAATTFSFGATPAAAPTTGGLFGQPAQQNASPFGQPAQPATSGGLFGQSAAAPATSGAFSFGATPAKPLFGAAPTSAAPAATPFGAAAAPKPTFSFGQPAAGGGLFGQPAAQTAAPAFGSAAPTTSLFGAAPAASNPFGQPATAAPTQTTSLFGGGGGLFSQKPAAPAMGGLFGAAPAGGSLFGQPAQQQPQQQPMGGSLFGNSLGSTFGAGASTAPQQQQQMQQSVYASADDVNAYGNNPLFASTSPATNAAATSTTTQQKKPPLFTAFRGTPVNRSSTKITRLRGFGSSVASPGQTGSPLNGYGSPGSPASARGSPLRFVAGGEDAPRVNSALSSRPSVKKLVIDRKGSDGLLGRSYSPSPTEASMGPKSPAFGAARPRVTFGGAESDAAREKRDREFEASSSRANPSEDTPVKKTTKATGPIGEDAQAKNKASPRTAAKPRERKEGEYYTEPPLESLQKLSAAQLSSVSNFVVGRQGFGEIRFSEPVDLTSLSSLEDICGGIVVFEDRNATVYPDADIKPPLGQGLNVPATIDLEKTWAKDKATRQPITDPSHPKYQQHEKRLRNMPDTKFVCFENGRWSFSVDGF